MDTSNFLRSLPTWNTTWALVTSELVLSAHYYQWPNFQIVPWYFCSEMRPKTNVIFCQNLENF